MEKRYQVFVSSTYVDLREERQKVVQTLMEMDCIPAVMEIFPAVDEEQWRFIQKVIDDCDYYVLIIGGRYGSLSSDGISFTEKEFDYAVSKGIPVLAFIHANPNDITAGKTDLDLELRNKLKVFKEKVTARRLVKSWTSAAELAGLVSLSLNRTIKTHPAVGWVRATAAQSREALLQLSQAQERLEVALRDNATLREENSNFKERLNSTTGRTQETNKNSLAGLNEPFQLRIRYESRSAKQVYAATMTWGEIFGSVAPKLQEHPNDVLVRKVIGAAAYRHLKHGELQVGETVNLFDPEAETIRIQLEALGLVEVRWSKTTQDTMALFWSLTPKGISTMLQLRTIKTAASKKTAR